MPAVVLKVVLTVLVKTPVLTPVLTPAFSQHDIPILINLESRAWTDDLDSTFAKQSPAQTLLQQLRKFYGNEIA